MKRRCGTLRYRNALTGCCKSNVSEWRRWVEIHKDIL